MCRFSLRPSIKKRLSKGPVNTHRGPIRARPRRGPSDQWSPPGAVAVHYTFGCVRNTPNFIFHSELHSVLLKLNSVRIAYALYVDKNIALFDVRTKYCVNKISHLNVKRV